MKTSVSHYGIIAVLFLTLSCLIFSQIKAQTIEIDRTFTTDEVIYPFEGADKIYGISISGYVTLTSDTSMVRIILKNDQDQEWMVYEAFPMIVKNYEFELTEECDETCFMEETRPISLSIQIIDAEFYLSTLNLNLSSGSNWRIRSN